MQISVILPVKDGLPHLHQALRSLVRQTYRDFEVIVLDDGSSDGSLEAARQFAGEHGRFKSVKGGPPGGIVAALNAAAATARGELLVRMDADDISAPNRLELHAAFCSDHPEVGLLGSRIRFFPRCKVQPGMAHYEGWINGLLTHQELTRDRFVECPIPHPSLAIRRRVFEQLGGYRDGPFPEDYELVLRAAEGGVKLAKLPQVLLYWREGPHRLSRKDPRYGLDRFFQLKLRFLVPLLKQLGRPVAVAGAGPHGKQLARGLAGAGQPVSYFLEVHPRRIGKVIHGAEVLGVSQLDRARGCFFLAAVGQKGGREQVRQILTEAGFHETDDFLCVQ